MIKYITCTESRVSVPSVWRMPAIVCGSALAFAAVLSVSLWSFRHDIKLAMKQKRRKPPSSEGIYFIANRLDYSYRMQHDKLAGVP